MGAEGSREEQRGAEIVVEGSRKKQSGAERVERSRGEQRGGWGRWEVMVIEREERHRMRQTFIFPTLWLHSFLSVHQEVQRQQQRLMGNVVSLMSVSSSDL